MAAGRESEAISEPGPRVKRRGILAAAGAVVAGVVAKQASQPVAATSGGGDQGYLTLGSNPWYISGNPINAINTAAISSAPTVIQASANYASFVGAHGAERVLFSVDGRTNASGDYYTSPFDGIHAYGWGGSGIGVYGEGNLGGLKGVVPNSSGGSAYAVYGANASTGSNNYGVYGIALNGVGTQGHIFPNTAPNTIGVYGYNESSGAGGEGTRGHIPASPGATNTVAVNGLNESAGAGGIGVKGTCASGLGASFQGGVAPLRLVPGSQSARTLTSAGHQAGELYFTSDNRLFVFDGTNWREVLLAAPGSGVPPAAAARPASAETTTQPVQPAPPPRP